MALEFKRAEAPVSNSATKFQAFNGTLLLVLPHSNPKSQFQREVKDANGNVIGKEDQYQTFATVIPLEDGSNVIEVKDRTVKVEWKAGDVFTSYFDGAIRRYLKDDLDTPILGRLGKGKPGKLGGKPWVLKSPTDDDTDLFSDMAEELDLEAKVEKARADFAERQQNKAATAAPKETPEDTVKVPW